MTEATEAKEQTIDALFQSILEENDLTIDDLAVLPRCERYLGPDNSQWELGKGAPFSGVATVLYIAEEGDDVRVYTAPVPRPDSTPAELELLTKGGRFVHFAVWRLKRTVKSMSISVMPTETFKTMLGKEFTRTLDELEGEDDEAEQMLEWLKTRPPGTALGTAIAGLEEGNHIPDDEDSELEAPPNGAALSAAAPAA